MRTRALTTAEYRRLLRHLPTREALVCRIMADTGLRVSDVLALRIYQIRRTMYITEGKTGKRRRVQLSPATLAAAKAYAADRRAGDKLIHADRSTIYRTISITAKALGMEHISAHSLRKYYAQKYCKRHGLEATRRELQHRDIMTTILYTTDYDTLRGLLHDTDRHD